MESNELYTSITTRIVETHTWRSNCSEYGTECHEVDKFKDIIVPGVEEGVFEIEHEGVLLCQIGPGWLNRAPIDVGCA